MPTKISESQADILTLAKSSAGGFPIGAMVASAKWRKDLDPRPRSPFGGNHLACSTALAVVNHILQDNIMEHNAKMGLSYGQI